MKVAVATTVAVAVERGCLPIIDTVTATVVDVVAADIAMRRYPSCLILLSVSKYLWLKSLKFCKYSM